MAGGRRTIDREQVRQMREPITRQVIEDNDELNREDTLAGKIPQMAFSGEEVANAATESNPNGGKLMIVGAVLFAAGAAMFAMAIGMAKDQASPPGILLSRIPGWETISCSVGFSESSSASDCDVLDPPARRAEEDEALEVN